MSQKQQQKIVLKKSSIEIEDEPQTTQNQEVEDRRQQNSKKIIKTQRKSSSHLDNLLDLEQSMAETKKQYEEFLENRVISIEGPELVTQNVIKSYKLYKIKSRKKDSQQFDTCVSRRFNDFQYLQKQLIEAYGGCIIPLLPQKNIWANLNMEGKEQIENRIKDLEKYLKSLLSHERLRKSEELRNFLFENENKFSQLKGQFFSKIKTEQTIKNAASNAYNLGKGFISKFINRPQMRQEQNIQILKPSIQDLKLIEFQREVTDLIKVINVLRRVVENSVLEMKTIGLLIPQSKQASFKYSNILSEFEDLCKYIFSCNEALMRRNQVRLQIDQLNVQYEGLQKRIKTNPRSQQMDILRNKLFKSTQKCQKWTNSLLEELQKSISVGKSMIEQFITSYTERKQKFYEL